MSNNKQSSIDFLLKELEEIGVLNIKNCHWSDEVDVKKAIEQARAMHEEEIVNTIVDCEKEHIIQAECYPPQFVLTKAEQYYNEKFGGNNDIH